jgi:hypothetical protein
MRLASSNGSITCSHTRLTGSFCCHDGVITVCKKNLHSQGTLFHVAECRLTTVIAALSRPGATLIHHFLTLLYSSHLTLLVHLQHDKTSY